MDEPVDLDRRKPVWLAMSEFYLDIELTDLDIERIAAIFKASGYSMAELRSIEMNEVGPVLMPNLWSIAGVWHGFDPEWLTAIKENIDRKRWRLFRRLHRRMIQKATKHHWDRMLIHF